MLATLIGIAVLLVLSAFFSGSETALTAASRPLMHQLENEGNHRAGVVNRLHAKKGRLISTILLGNNLVNILASALATSTLISIYGDTGVIYATIAMTLLILIFSEIMPKTYAFKKANRLALAIAPTVSVLVFVLSPATKSINLVLKGIFRIFGYDIHGDEALRSTEGELRGAIELHIAENDKDTAVRHEREMLHGILDLDDVQVSEIMVHRKNVTTINADQPPSVIVAEVLASPFTRIPLWRGQPENIVGVLHAKALFRALRDHSDNPDEIDIVAIAAKPWFIPESTTLLDQLHAFRRRREHFSITVDEYGSLMGVVTLEDILEEIVGDISDEHDITETGVHPQGDGSYAIDGDVTIRDINRKFGWRLPDEEAATLAGLVLHESRRIPEVGQTFIFHGFRFKIMKRRRHQITSILVTPPKPDDTAGS